MVDWVPHLVRARKTIDAACSAQRHGDASGVANNTVRLFYNVCATNTYPAGVSCILLMEILPRVAFSARLFELIGMVIGGDWAGRVPPERYDLLAELCERAVHFHFECDKSPRVESLSHVNHLEFVLWQALDKGEGARAVNIAARMDNKTASSALNAALADGDARAVLEAAARVRMPDRPPPIEFLLWDALVAKDSARTVAFAQCMVERGTAVHLVKFTRHRPPALTHEELETFNAMMLDRVAAPARGVWHVIFLWMLRTLDPARCTRLLMPMQIVLIGEEKYRVRVLRMLASLDVAPPPASTYISEADIGVMRRRWGHSEDEIVRVAEQMLVRVHSRAGK